MGADQINSAIQQLSMVTQQNASSSEEMASSSEEMSNQAVELEEIMRFFKVNKTESTIKNNATNASKKEWKEVGIKNHKIQEINLSPFEANLEEYTHM